MQAIAYCELGFLFSRTHAEQAAKPAAEQTAAHAVYAQVGAHPSPLAPIFDMQKLKCGLRSKAKYESAFRSCR